MGCGMCSAWRMVLNHVDLFVAQRPINDPVEAMSGTYVDCTLLPSEWDSVEAIRERLRNGKPLIVSEDSMSTVKIPKCSANQDVLIPILAQVGAGYRLAEIDGLRDAVAKIYADNSRQTTEDMIDDAAWAIRDMVYFVKRKTQRSEVSKATS